MKWDDAMICSLSALWLEGHSTAEIGRRMGISKNAVIGKVGRLHLQPRPSPIRPVGSGKPRRPPRPQCPKVTLIPTASELAGLPVDIIAQLSKQARVNAVQCQSKAREVCAPATQVLAAPVARTAVPLPRRAQLRPRAFSVDYARTCQWIDGHPAGKDTRFCGAKSVLGCSWCAEHRALVFSRMPVLEAA